MSRERGNQPPNQPPEEHDDNPAEDIDATQFLNTDSDLDETVATSNVNPFEETKFDDTRKVGGLSREERAKLRSNVEDYRRLGGIVENDPIDSTADEIAKAPKNKIGDAVKKAILFLKMQRGKKD